MISRKMWQHLQRFLEKYALPYFIIGYNPSTKTTFKRNWNCVIYTAMQLVIAFVYVLLLLWYNSRQLAAALVSSDNAYKSIVVTFALLLIPCFFILYVVCWWTITLNNENNFTTTMNVLAKFDAKLQGFEIITN
jgi:hypothetical protein